MQKTKSRLFALGCSFTNYAWPSWADIIGLEYDVYENWAYPGLGNRAIAERVANLHAVKTLTPQDTVLIQWTSHLRHDWHANDSRHHTEVGIGWKTSGSIFNFINEEIFDKKWLKTFFDENSYMMHTLNHILLTKQFLESLGVNYYMTSMGYINKMNSDYPTEAEEAWHGETNTSEIDIWKDIPSLQIYKDKIFDDKWIYPIGTFAWKHKEKPYKFITPKGMPIKDRHPTINQHNDYVQQIVKPKLGLSQNTHKVAEYWIDNVNSSYDNCYSNFNEFCTIVQNLVGDRQNFYRGF